MSAGVAARAAAPVAKGTKAISPLTKSTTSAPDHEQITRLAYCYWQDRGCPEGTPQEDWLRAEAEQLNQSAATEVSGIQKDGQ